jgi:hypothetical protein
MAESVRELLDEDGRLMVGFFLASAFSMLCSNSAAATRSNSSFTLWSAFVVVMMVMWVIGGTLCPQ